MSVFTPTILSAGKKMELAFELVSIDITKEVNRIPNAQLILLDGDLQNGVFEASDDAYFEPGKEIEIKMRYEDAPDQEATVFKGLVVGQAVQANQQGMLLTIEIKDAAIKLAASRKSVLYQDKSDDKIIADMIAAVGLKKGTLSATQAKHKQLVQYYCTDWDFILSRAESCGLLLVVEDGEISMPEIAIKGAAKHTFEFGLSEIYDFEIEAYANHQVAEVESIAWDVKTQKLTKAAKAKSFELSQGNLDAAKIAKTLGGDSQTLNNPIALDPQELQAWSDGVLARTRLSMIRGRVSVPGFADLKLMDVMELEKIGKRYNGKTLVTGIRQRVDQQGWQTDIQFGLPHKRFSEQRDLIDIPAAGLLPAVNGLQIGIVDKFEADPDKEFRLKVILPGIDEKEGAIWARLATPDAGVERGYFFRPEPGDEVVVGFFNDDPRQAVVLGAMFSSKNAPPQAVSSLEEKNINKAIISKTGTTLGFIDDEKSSVFIETPEANKILFDDDAQTVQISDQHGNDITMSKDGITIKSAKDLKIDAAGNVEIKGKKVDIK
jgi:Rhs element Vgr protein